MAKFKKGNTEAKKGRKPDLKIKTKRGSSRVELHIRLGHGRDTLRPFARAIYEATTGNRIPGEVVIFKDGDASHCKFENLELLTRSEAMRRNLEHDDSELIEANLEALVLAHVEEIALVLEYFSRPRTKVLMWNPAKKNSPRKIKENCKHTDFVNCTFFKNKGLCKICPMYDVD